MLGKLAALAVVGVIAAGGAWAWAGWQVTDRIVELERAVRAMPLSRGLVEPSPEDIEARAREAGVVGDVEVSRVIVTVEALTDDNAHLAGEAITGVRDALTGIERTRPDDRGRPVHQRSELSARLVTIELDVTATEWMASESRTIVIHRAFAPELRFQ